MKTMLLAIKKDFFLVSSCLYTYKYNKNTIQNSESQIRIDQNVHPTKMVVLYSKGG